MFSSNKDSRDAILGRIRSALNVADSDRARGFLVQKKLRGRSPNPVPSRTKLPFESLMALFQTMLESQAASVAHIESPSGVAQAVSSYLSSQNLAKIIRTGDDALFEEQAWDAVLIERKSGAASGKDQMALSHAVAGASETGTLFLLSGPANPTSLNFVPENHIVVIHSQDISGSYEDAWERIKRITGADRRGAAALPRTVNLISGPSRTGDIEQTIILGAHGPRRLHVIIIDD